MEFSCRTAGKANHPLVIQGTLDLVRIAVQNLQVVAMSPVRVTVTVEAAEHLCEVGGRVGGEVTYRCSRCLTEYHEDLQSEIRELFTDVALKADEDTHYVTDDLIVLDPYVEEAVQLAVEQFPVCMPGCRGLCPVCGTILNEGTCQCDTRAVDPRWAALQGLHSSDDSK